MFRRLFTLAAAVSLLLALLCVAVSVRGRFATDEWLFRRWSPTDRTFDTVFLQSAGGTVFFVRTRTTLAPDADTTQAEQFTAPNNRRLRYRTQKPARSSQWLLGEFYQTAAHGTVINPGGLAERTTLVFQPAVVAVAVLALPLAWAAARLLRHWRRRRRRLAGHCPVCGYDLRHSPDRCPECGTPVPASAAPPADPSADPSRL